MEIKRFVGIPYWTHGSSFEGCDCWGLVELFTREYMKAEPPKMEGSYTNASDKKSVSGFVINNLDSFIERPKSEDRELGDILLFNIGGMPCHVGIALSNTKMIHTLSGRDSCMESYNNFLWTRRLHGVYTWAK